MSLSPLLPEYTQTQAHTERESARERERERESERERKRNRIAYPNNSDLHRMIILHSGTLDPFNQSKLVLYEGSHQDPTSIKATIERLQKQMAMLERTSDNMAVWLQHPTGWMVDVSNASVRCSKSDLLLSY